MELSPQELAALPGVSPSRTHQIVPGALVACTGGRGRPQPSAVVL